MTTADGIAAPAPASPSAAPAAIERWRKPPRWVLLLLLCLALVVRGKVMQSGVASLREDPDSYRSVAWQVYRYHTIGLRFNERGVDRAPTATRPPLYPLLLSVADFAHEEFEPYGFGFLHVVLGIATVYAVWCWANTLEVGWPVALLAAGLVAIDPLLLHQSTQLMTETLATLLAVLALWTLTHATHDARPRWVCLAGALLGLCILCRPTFLAWSICVVPILAWHGHRWRPIARAAVATAALLGVVAPWAIRNQHYFGRPVITTTHGGATLLLANNPLFYDYLRSAPWGEVWDARNFYRRWRPQRNTIALRWVDGKAIFDEVAIDRLAYQTAWENIRREPAMFAYACLVRVGRLWNVLPHQTTPDESASRRGQRIAVAIWYTLQFVLAALGAWSLGRKLLRAPWCYALLLLLSFTAVHLLYWTDMRMRAPLVPVIAVLAALGVATLATKRRLPSPDAAMI